MTYKVVVSIINYRTADLTLACATSVLSDLEGIDGQVVILDNQSRDGSVETIEGWLSENSDRPVCLIRSKTNSGFSGGHNQVFTAMQAEYFLVLNSDAVIRPGFFAKLLSVADAKSGTGIIAPRIETEDGTTQISRFRFPGPQSEFIRGAATAQLTALMKKHIVALSPPVTEDLVEWVSFACVLLRAEMVSDIGPMDEGYFLYFEDCEYCLRARKKGWRITLADEAVAVHFRGGSGPVKTLQAAQKRLPAYYYASRTRFFRHAHGVLGPVLCNIAWILGRAVAQLRRLIAKPVAPRTEHEMRDIWINTLRPLRGPSGK
ncbi:MAG: glycosyltransferase family 2 protein [Pseudomonadota bacterium]